jgi:hypothetical protein
MNDNAMAVCQLNCGSVQWPAIAHEHHVGRDEINDQPLQEAK